MLVYQRVISSHGISMSLMMVYWRLTTLMLFASQSTDWRRVSNHVNHQTWGLLTIWQTKQYPLVDACASGFPAVRLILVFGFKMMCAAGINVT